MRQAGLRQRNFPLLVGALLGIAFLLLAIFGPSLAPKDPMEPFRVIKIDGEWYNAPYRPLELEGFPLGTDQIGRDLLSRLLWAIRPTMILSLVVVFARMGIGVFLGLVAGWYRSGVERLIDALTGAALAIPLLVFAIAVISYLGTERGLVAFVIALSLTGWAETASFVKGRTVAIIQEPYIEGARAIGVKPWRILTRHALPQLWPVLPSLIAFELAAVTLLVAELGFLGIFIGGGTTYGVQDPNSSGQFMITTSGMPELGQLMADFWAKIIQTPWVPFMVGSVVFLQIFAFNMLGEGFRRYMDVTRPRRSFLRTLFGGPQAGQPAPKRTRVQSA